MTQIKKIWYIKCSAKKHPFEIKPIIADASTAKVGITKTEFIKQLKRKGWRIRPTGYVCEVCVEKKGHFKKCE